MEQLYQAHIAQLNRLKTSFRRNFIDEIPWNERLVAIKGARGVGKTTLIQQYIKETYGNSTEALYISMDTISLKGHSIIEVADHHVAYGGKHLFVDEVHKYPDWSQELKNIYDQYPDLKVTVTSSSILQLYKANHDLSRRMVAFDMHGLSLREYINIETEKSINAITLDNLLANHIDIAAEISSQVNILSHMKNYLQYGYYPFYLEGKATYVQKLYNTINLILDVDLPHALGINVHNIYKIRKLLSNLAKEVPFQPNISKIAGSLELTRSTLNQYIHYLDTASLLNILLAEGKSYSLISKPEKIYLHNTNLSFAISDNNANLGNIRETFFLNQCSVKHIVQSSKKGDFLVDEKLTFEIGGKSKNNKQIWDQENSYLAVDEILIGVKNKIPIWLFGFLY